MDQQEMLDKILTKVVEIDQRLDSFTTKDELQALENRMTTAFDEQLQILQRLDQERVFTIERVKRIEDDVQQLKTHLKLA